MDREGLSLRLVQGVVAEAYSDMLVRFREGVFAAARFGVRSLVEQAFADSGGRLFLVMRLRRTDLA